MDDKQLTTELEVTIDQIFEQIQDRVQQVNSEIQKRKNRGAMLIQIVEPMMEDDNMEPGDVREAISPEGKKHDVEVIDAYQIMADHPEYGPVPCWAILAEVLNPDRMTKDDFESLYGEADDEANDDQSEEGDMLEASEVSGEELPHERVPGKVCECGADLSDCQLNQEYFGVHVNS